MGSLVGAHTFLETDPLNRSLIVSLIESLVKSFVESLSYGL
jgi:hypothetical protein